MATIIRSPEDLQRLMLIIKCLKSAQDIGIYARGNDWQKAAVPFKVKLAEELCPTLCGPICIIYQGQRKCTSMVHASYLSGSIRNADYRQTRLEVLIERAYDLATDVKATATLSPEEP